MPAFVPRHDEQSVPPELRLLATGNSGVSEVWGPDSDSTCTVGLSSTRSRS